MAGGQIVLQVAIVLVLIGRWHQQLDILVPQFVGRVAKQSLGSRVERFDQALFINGDDGVDGGFEDGARRRFAILQSLVRALQRGNVSDDSGKHPPVAEPKLADRQVRGECGAVAAPPNDFATDADDLFLGGRQVIEQVAVMFLSKRRRHENADVLTDEIRGGEAKHPLRGRIDGFDRPTLIDRDNRIDGGVQDGVSPGIAFAQRLFGKRTRLFAQHGDLGISVAQGAFRRACP